MGLMPVSSVVVWILLAQVAANSLSLLPVVSGVGSFYALWAIRNRCCGGNPRELGHVSMGTLAAGATLGMCFDGAPWAYWITLTGCFMVFVSVAFVLSKIACWPLSKLAHVSQKTPIWAAVFKVYLLLMLLQMAVIGVLLIFELNGV
jgi:hypothetical protein